MDVIRTVNYPDEDGLIAQLACCTCGGGIVDGYTYLERCEDYRGFYDCHDDPCSWYEEQDIDLDYYDDDEVLAGYITRCGLECPADEVDDYYVTPQEACCFCGGGNLHSGKSAKSSKSYSSKSSSSSSSSTTESSSSSSSSGKSSKSRRMQAW